MRQLFSGEIARLALAAIASVATVGLFMFLALKEPGSRDRASDAAPEPVAPGLELRHEAGESPEPEPEPPPPRKKTVEEVPQTLPQQQEAPQHAVETDEGLTPPPPATPKASEPERSVLLPKPKHRPKKFDLEPRTSGKRLPFSGVVRSPASFTTLPNRKCGVGEDSYPEPPLNDPFSEFIGAF